MRSDLFAVLQDWSDRTIPLWWRDVKRIAGQLDLFNSHYARSALRAAIGEFHNGNR